MVNEFKVGDQVAHPDYGAGKIRFYSKSCCVCTFKGVTAQVSTSDLRPRNFLSKIAEEQEVKGEVEMPLVSAPPMGPQWAVVDQQFNEVFNKPTVIGVDMASGPDVGFEAIVTPQGFREIITDAYGIKRDPVTLMEIESDGLVKISSIRDSVREIS